MEESPPGTPPSVRSPEDRLDSWKEIAAYFNRDVSTVQRWEKREGMPVHRHVHSRMGSVYALRADLEAWARSRNLRPAQDEESEVLLPGAPRGSSRPNLSSSARGWALILVLTAAVALSIGAFLWFKMRDSLWRNPIADARFQRVTDFDGAEQAAAVSRDGQFVAFLSNREGEMDVWVTQVGSGQFHNLTRGSGLEMVNPLVRTLGFSPDGSLVTLWVRKQNGSGRGDISVWVVPTLGGQPRQYLEGVAECDWSHDGSRVAYHTRALETRCSWPTAAADPRVGPSSRPRPGYTLTFRCGHPMGDSSTSSRAHCPTIWTSGASLPPAELRNGSPQIIPV